jgi:hypothetical protein
MGCPVLRSATPNRRSTTQILTWIKKIEEGGWEVDAARYQYN